MKFERFRVEEMQEIVTISKLITVRDDDDDDSPSPEEGALEQGKYCVTSDGTIWRRMTAATELLAIFDMKDPQRQKERIEVRERLKKRRKA